MVSSQILIVCTGNVCRSPALEMMLRSRSLGPSWPMLGIGVGSAGTAALIGQPIELAMRQCLLDLGVEPDDSFSARQVTAAMVESASMIVTASREHRAEVFRLAPSAVPRTFTAAELVVRTRSWEQRGSTPEERLAALVLYAAQMRGVRAFARPDDEDLVDPFGRSRRIHRRSASHLVAVARALTAAIAP